VKKKEDGGARVKKGRGSPNDKEKKRGGAVVDPGVKNQLGSEKGNTPRMKVGKSQEFPEK